MHRLLAPRTQGEKHVVELLRTEPGEEVGLVLGPVGGPGKTRPAAGTDQAGVMAGGDPVHTGGAHGLGQQAELDLLVAVHAGVGGQPGAVAVDKRADHPVGERLLEVDHGQRHGQPVGHLAHPLQLRVPPGQRQAHEKTVHPPALFAQKQGGDSGVDSAAHGDADVQYGHW